MRTEKDMPGISMGRAVKAFLLLIPVCGAVCLLVLCVYALVFVQGLGFGSDRIDGLVLAFPLGCFVGIPGAAAGSFVYAMRRDSKWWMSVAVAAAWSMVAAFLFVLPQVSNWH